MNSMLIVIQNVIQYFSMKPLLVYLKNHVDWDIDIIVFNGGRSQDFMQIALEAKHALENDGFIVYDIPPRKFYKIVFAPYQDMVDVEYKYLIGYCYGAANTKPYVFAPEHKMKFHAMLLHDIFNFSLYEVYAKPYLVPDLYIQRPKQHTKNKKPVLLYLPTYNEPGVERIAKSLEKLKDRYYLIIKGHHGIQFLNTEATKKDILMEIADEYYGSGQYIQPLFDRADVVLSDNSGAIMDALYIQIPVAIASLDINSHSFAGINTLQYELVQKKIIPYTKELNSEAIAKILRESLSKKVIDLQCKASDQLFPAKKGGAKAWFDILNMYMEDNVDQNYCKLHDYYINNYISNMNSLKNENQLLLDELNLYKNSKLHRAVNRIQKIIH